MWETLELPRVLLNGFNQKSGSDMDNGVQAEVVSDRNKKLSGKCLPFGYGKLIQCLYHHCALEAVNSLSISEAHRQK